MADPPGNLQQQPPADVLDATLRAMTTMAENMSLNNVALQLPIFDGSTPDLRDFIQDVRNARQHFQPAQEPTFITAVLARLRGPARTSCFGRTFDNTENLIKHLKDRFAPGKDYDYYANRLNNLKMGQAETVSDFYDRLRVLLSAAENCLKMELPEADRQVQLPLLIRPLKRSCKDIFIRGLSPALATLVDTTQPADLDAAYQSAV